MAVCDEIRKREEHEVEIKRLEAEALQARKERELVQQQRKQQAVKEKAANQQDSPTLPMGDTSAGIAIKPGSMMR